MPTSFSLLRGSDMPSRRANRVKGRAVATLENSQRGSPEFVDEEYQAILENMITEEYLIDISGANDLKDVSHLEIVVDTNLQSLLDLNEKLPNLKSLVLDNSVITTIRDLGVGLRSLTVLSINSCDLSDIDGIGVLTNLQELNICDNNISDITPLAMHDCLQVLNLSGNNLCTFSFADTLSSCPNVRSLFLARNPIECAPSYRLVVSSLISTLHLLDGQPVDFEARSKVSNSMIIESVTVMLKKAEELGEKALTSSSKSSVESSQPFSHREKDLLKSSTDTGSELTHGNAVVLAGNAAMAMRRRRTRQVQTDAESTALDALDRALLSGQQSSADAVRFFGEGDVTPTLSSGSHKTYCALDRSDRRQRRVDNSSSSVVKSWSSFSSAATDMGLAGGSKQRPQSAIVTYRGRAPLIAASDRPSARACDDSSLPKNAPSAPFKVLADAESQKWVLRDRENKKFCNNEESDVGANGKTTGVHTRAQAAGMAAPSPSSTSNEPSSIVHRDIVRRTLRSAGDESGSEDEDISITHSSRHSLMSRSSRVRGGAASSGAGTCALSPGTILGRESSASTHIDHHIYSLDNNNMLDSVTTSMLSRQTAKAGALLGFNLADSLAAIDQWVDETDSHSDESAPADEERAGARRGISAPQAWSSTGKFLTRENIINMCTGGEAQSTQALGAAVQEKVISSAPSAARSGKERTLKQHSAMEAPQKAMSKAP